MVKIERTPTPPPSLALRQSYREEDVLRQLYADSCGKCYLCERAPVQSVEVEHLKAHHGGKYPDRKYDWNNLFFSCSHCNSIKNQAIYAEDILDCCAVEPEALLCQELLAGAVRVTPIGTSESARLTAQLLTECFEKQNTGIRILECKVLVDALQTKMNQLYRALKRYEKTKTSRNLRLVRLLLQRGQPFAGFTRTYVRQNLHRYLELAEDVRL